MNLLNNIALSLVLISGASFGVEYGNCAPLVKKPVVDSPVSFGTHKRINSNWLFCLGDNAEYRNDNYSDAAWRVVQLPHDWSVEGEMSPELNSCTGYLPGGIGWYRKHLDIKNTKQKQYIYFEGVYNRSEVYVNGHKVGERPNGYASALYDITPYIRKGDNVIAVRVDHSREADSRFYTGSGIYRNVYHIVSNASHISQWGVGTSFVENNDKSGRLDVEVSVENVKPSMTIESRLYDNAGKLVGVSNIPNCGGSNKMSINVAKPHLWDIEDPYIYKLETTLKEGDKVIDRSVNRVGLRTATFDADKGFFLNGKNMKLKGVCLHHDAGVLGAAVPKGVWERKLRKLKEMGANAIRTAHNPHAPEFYDACDEVGLLVMDEASDEWEFPKRKWLKGWNCGEPGYQGSHDFFEAWIDRDVEDMVRRDRNHPSIIMWSIGNEVDYPNDPYSHPVLNGSSISQPMYGGYDPKRPNAERIGKIAERLSAKVRAIDSSRPVTGALAGVVMSNETAYPGAVDVVGYNYTEGRYDKDHKQYPNRIIYGSENGRDYWAWKAVTDRDFISGQFIWTGTDYLGESRPWPSRGFGTGLLDFRSYQKGQGNFRKALWSTSPVAYVGTYIKEKDSQLREDAPALWNYADGSQVRVVCYTNQPQARLLVNGQEVGEPRKYDPETGIIFWDVPYAPGEVTVEAMDTQGGVTAINSVKTYGKGTDLRIVAEAGDGDENVSHLLIDAVDRNGNIAGDCEEQVSVSVSGPARLLGLENGNNEDTTLATSSEKRLFEGRMVGYVQRTGKGKIKITITSPRFGKKIVSI